MFAQGVRDWVRVVVMAVEENDPLETHRGKGRAEILDERHERRYADVHQPLEAHVRIRQRVVDGGRHHGVDRRSRATCDLLRDVHVR